MAELKDSAEQFAKDLMNQNIAGLMMAFTPNGMGQAMALQGQMAAQPQPTGTPSVTVNVTGQEGEDHLVDLVMGSDGSPGPAPSPRAGRTLPAPGRSTG